MTKATKSAVSKSEETAATGAGLAVTDTDTHADAAGSALADDWAAALAEQQSEAPGAGDGDGDSRYGGSAEPREFAAGQDARSAAAEASATAEPAGAQVFKPLDKGSERRSAARDLDMIIDIPVKLNVELGRTRLTIKQLLELSEGSVLELDGLAGDPLDILINGYLVAQGEVVVVDDKYGIRITEIVTPSERVHKLNR